MDTFYYRKLPCGIMHLSTNREMFLLGVFTEQNGNLRRFDGNGRIDVNAKLISVETLPDAPDDFKLWVKEEPEFFESQKWDTMYGTIAIGQTVFTPGMYLDKEKALQGK